jgi:flagellar motility protein MotE (MotC chaperone)
MTRKIRVGSGALVVVALLLASSGAVRLGTNFGAAMAEMADLPSAGLQDLPTDCAAPPVALARALKSRDSEISAREAAYEERRAALGLAEQAIGQRMAELQAAEVALKKTLAIADGAAEKDLTTLTAVYEAMKPNDATKVFAAMAPEFAAGFLGRMQPAAAAAILAGMTPDQAYSISILIAGRNARAPKT